jgi:hypothetical protein
LPPPAPPWEVAATRGAHWSRFDGLELSMSQVRAIEILLRKSVPDLTKTEVQADATHRYVAQLPEVLSREEWLAKYGEGQTTLQ